jgi:hypothetical protein
LGNDELLKDMKEKHEAILKDTKKKHETTTLKELT